MWAPRTGLVIYFHNILVYVVIMILQAVLMKMTLHYFFFVFLYPEKEKPSNKFICLLKNCYQINYSYFLQMCYDMSRGTGGDYGAGETRLFLSRGLGGGSSTLFGVDIWSGLWVWSWRKVLSSLYVMRGGERMDRIGWLHHGHYLTAKVAQDLAINMDSQLLSPLSKVNQIFQT